MAKLTIDGREIEAKDGQSVLQAALDHGIHIPHLCYHPALKVVGSCRMCLIEIEKVPKLQVACGTAVRDGMVVSTQSERVKKARRGVLEFLLINHPLDCPVCDQAGECKLQDYCFEHGQAESRYQEDKRKFPEHDLGANLARDMNRCIHCTRCIRFLRDVAGAEAFTLYERGNRTQVGTYLSTYERGNRTQVGTYLSTPVESPYSLNLVEVCPVGALTSRHFRFKGRSWLMEKTRTLCAGCSRGCNVYAWSQKGKVLRLTPAKNDQVNRIWMCDYGRLSIDAVYSGDRLQDALRLGDCVNLDAALDEAAAKLKKYVDDGAAIGVVASARLTNEDNYLIRKLAREVLGTKHLAFVEGQEDDRPFEPSDRPLPEWFQREDKTPNSWGARDIIMSTEQEGDVAGMIEKTQKGELKALLVFGEDLTQEKAVEAEFLFVADTHKTRTVELAHIAVPEAAFLEKGGTFTNEEGRVQRLRPAVAPMGCARPAWQTAQELARRMGADWRYRATAEVTAEISAKVPGYQDVDYIDMPDEGLKVEHA